MTEEKERHALLTISLDDFKKYKQIHKAASFDDAMGIMANHLTSTHQLTSIYNDTYYYKRPAGYNPIAFYATGIYLMKLLGVKLHQFIQLTL